MLSAKKVLISFAQTLLLPFFSLPPLIPALFMLPHRGFFPKGGGLVVVDTSPVKNLTSVVMTEKGEVTRVKLTAYVAGSMPPKLLKQMTRAAKQCLEPKLPSGTAISCEEVRETRDSAFGNGSGIM